ncbi:PepSY-associated TM helix domain-containing protein [Spongiibacter marinus]|uniref:PepSY-associated TM helix domain-containing protein n=1 Tax=Spongiibacter marinus TaxID=354246 RepID=UPI003C6681F4
MNAYRRWRISLLRWHRRIGVLLAIFVVNLVVTGIAINHSSGLSLNERHVDQEWLLSLYGINAAEQRSFLVGDNYLSQAGDSGLYIGKQALLSCEGALLGAVALVSEIYALCEDRLLVFSQDAALLDDLSAAYGLPEGLQSLAEKNGRLYLRDRHRVYQYDPLSLQFTIADEPPATIWAKASTPPLELDNFLQQRHRGKGPSWERVLLDLHSGRLFGDLGVWVVDIAAVALLLIALSGVWVWVTKPGRWRKK